MFKLFRKKKELQMIKNYEDGLSKTLNEEIKKERIPSVHTSTQTIENLKKDLREIYGEKIQRKKRRRNFTYEEENIEETWEADSGCQTIADSINPEEYYNSDNFYDIDHYYDLDNWYP